MKAGHARVVVDTVTPPCRHLLENFTAERVPDTGSPLNFGGLSVDQTLKPGETFRKEIDLWKWFTFKKPGTYEITGTYLLSFFTPANEGRFVAWEDYAAASFNIVIR